MIKRNGWVAIAVAGAVTGCIGEAPEADAGVVSARDSAGIRIVESEKPQFSSGEWLIDSIPSLRIGSEAAGPYQFAFITDVKLIQGEAISVAEAQSGELRIFDLSGEHQWTVGGQGDGPEEFRMLARVIPIDPDSVAGYDDRLRRTTIFPIAGGSARTLPNSVDGNFSVFGLIEDGPFLLYSPGGSFRPDLEPGGQWVETPIVAMDPITGSADTVATLPDRWRVVDQQGNAPMPQPLFYAVQASSRDGFYWGVPDEFAIEKYDRSGKLRQIARRAASSVKVEPEMIREHIETQLESTRRYQGEEAADALRARLESEEYRDELPYFNAALVDQENRLWVGRYDWPDRSGPVTWSVFAPTGEWLWDVEAPAGLQLFDATADAVLGVARDAFDVPYVQMHPLRRVDPSD